MKIITFNKSQCSRIITPVIVGSVRENVSVGMLRRYCVPSNISDKLCTVSKVSGILG
jgi:hypothetical protein